MGLGNDVVARRIQARGGLTGPLGDYAAALPNRVVMTREDGPRGPLTSPTVAPAAATDEISLLMQIRDLLSRMPVSLSDEFRTRFIVQPRESVSFIVPGTNLALPADGQPYAIAAFQMNQGFTGFLTHVGVNVSPSGGFPGITWQIRVNNNIHPNFANRVFSASTIATPIPFAFELVQSRTVQLVAINAIGGGAVDVAGVLVGWTEFMADYKRYGAAPQSGIA